jgi:hypothetical protein
MLNHSSTKYIHLYSKMMPSDLKKAHSEITREKREPVGDLGFKGFSGGKPIFFKKTKGK